MGEHFIEENDIADLVRGWSRLTMPADYSIILSPNPYGSVK